MSDDIRKWPCENFSTCGNTIFFGPKDEEYYKQQGWVRPDGSVIKPRRCKPCRAKKRAEKARELQNG